MQTGAENRGFTAHADYGGVDFLPHCSWLRIGGRAGSAVALVAAHIGHFG